MGKPAKNSKEVGGPNSIRCKSKSAITLSPEEQARQDKDDEFLITIEKSGDYTAVETMLKEGQTVNVGDENRESACHKACRARSKEILEVSRGEANTRT